MRIYLILFLFIWSFSLSANHIKKGFKELANKMLYLIENESVRQEMGFNARKYFENNYPYIDFCSVLDSDIIEFLNRNYLVYREIKK